MKADTIKAIFTNLLFVIGVILLIIGFTQGALTATRIATFDKYPLQSFEEDRCSLQFARPMVEDESVRSKALCETSIEQMRKVKQTEDIVTSISMLFAGILLVAFFRRFILK